MLICALKCDDFYPKNKRLHAHVSLIIMFIHVPIHPCMYTYALYSLTETKEELKKCKEELKSSQKDLASQVEELRNENEKYTCIHIRYTYVLSHIRTYACSTVNLKFKTHLHMPANSNLVVLCTVYLNMKFVQCNCMYLWMHLLIHTYLL